MRRGIGWLWVALVAVALCVGTSDDAWAKKGRKSKKKPAPAKVEKAPAPAPAPAADAAPAGEEGRALRRGERIEFDGRLIQGQTAKAGAVYLFERASSNLRSMVKDRTSFRDKIIRTVFPKAKEGEEENES